MTFWELQALVRPAQICMFWGDIGINSGLSIYLPDFDPLTTFITDDPYKSEKWSVKTYMVFAYRLHFQGQIMSPKQEVQLIQGCSSPL